MLAAAQTLTLLLRGGCGGDGGTPSLRRSKGKGKERKETESARSRKRRRLVHSEVSETK